MFSRIGLTKRPRRSIEFDAALNQIHLFGDAEAQLLSSVQKLGNVGASDAREFIEPFLKLGPAGEAISAVASRYLPAFTANGKTAKEAGEELAKSFVDITKGGGEVIANSRVLTEEEKRKAQALIASGDAVGAYRYALDILARSFDHVAEQQRKAKADIEDAQTKMAIGILTADNFAGAEDLLAAATANATQKTRDQEEEFSRWLLKAAMATDQAGRLAAAMKDALKVDKTTADIKELEGKVKEFRDALGTTRDPETIAQLNRAIDIASDKLKKARDELSGGLIGGSGLERINRENQALADAYKGPPAGLLRQQLANVQGVANDPTKDAKQREEAEAEASRLTRQIRDADFEDEKSKLDQRATLAGKNSAAVIAIREQEVARARAVYGAGSREEMRAEEELARAREKGSERGAKAGEKAAKDALAAAREGYAGQIAEAERVAADDIKLIELRAKAHKLGAQEAGDAVKTALEDEKRKVDDFYAHELALAGQTQDEITKIKKKWELEDLTIDDQMVLNAEKASEATTKAWTQGANQISGAINSQWRSLLSGQETWGQAAKKILADWVITGIEDATKLSVNVIAQYVMTGNAATVSGAVQAAAQQTAAAGGIAALVANALRAVTVDAGVTFAGVFANLAPVMGPFAAGPAAAAQATVAGVAAFDIGAWNVPHDQLAMIHKGEMVPTASQSEAIRSLPGILARGGGAGGHSVSVAPTTHFHVSSMDSATVERTLLNNQSAVVRAIDEAVRHGVHLGMRRFRV